LAPGETRVIDVTFPAEYGAKELAGKQATFEITAKALNIANTPVADDEFAKQLGLESLADLEKDIAARIVEEFAQLSRLKQKRGLLDALAERAQFAVPESLVEAEFAEIWRQVEQEKAAGRADPEDETKDEATLKAEYRGIADRRVRLGLLVAEIGRANDITVTEQDLRRAMVNEAMRYRDQAMQVFEFFNKNPAALERFRGPIFEDKVVDYLLGQVQLEEVTVTPDALAADPES
jgi:trigger factor